MSIYEYSVQVSNGEEQSMEHYKGKVLLIVNTATKCGLAPQFNELQSLYETYKEEGFTVLAFPSNQFMNQEPGTDEEVKEACSVNFGVTFPIFKKIDVNGKDTHPLFQYLKQETKGLVSSAIKWNFTKFLVDKEGKVVSRYSPTTTPEKIEGDIQRLLKG
ncbi:glutathione peroxidase [Alkalihalobacillus sp. LMS39]|uniref:glutathione peroxidase n=1 Tax=Alkalihalobacillus sp. LMS39 TaxID=2924032 RepID=UPI001FB387C8|nr:glutathione peroxidase [Alkalihalobacillus sp. LMS39]UOE94601.1 glutathione peroxidase [Alkalihalobacillus sp. LMS39]